MEPLPYQNSHAYCKSITKNHNEPLYLASYLLPVKKREAIHSLFAFYNFVNEGAERAETVLEKQSHLKKCNEVIDRIYESRRPEFAQPFELAFEQSVFRYGIPKKLTQDMLAGMVLKTHFRQPKTEDELISYADHATGSLFHMMTIVFGSTKEIERSAIAFGSAMEVIRVAQQTRTLLQHGKVIYPEDWMTEAGVSHEEASQLTLKKKTISGKSWIKKLWAVHEKLLDLGIRLNKEGSELIPHLVPDGSRNCVALLSSYQNYRLHKFKRQGVHSFFQSPSFSAIDKLIVLFQSRRI